MDGFCIRITNEDLITNEKKQRENVRYEGHTISFQTFFLYGHLKLL